jgi:hypothetical protein
MCGTTNDYFKSFRVIRVIRGSSSSRWGTRSPQNFSDIGGVTNHDDGEHDVGEYADFGSSEEKDQS